MTFLLGNHKFRVLGSLYFYFLIGAFLALIL